MRKLFLLFVFISGFSFGQMENYVIQDGQVQWQKVFETTKTFDEVFAAVKNKNNIKNMYANSTEIYVDELFNNWQD